MIGVIISIWLALFAGGKDFNSGRGLWMNRSRPKPHVERIIHKRPIKTIKSGIGRNIR